MTAEELVSDGTVSVKEACKMLSVCRTRLYELMGTGQLRYIQLTVGGNRRIPRKAIGNLLAASLVTPDANKTPRPNLAEELARSVRVTQVQTLQQEARARMKDAADLLDRAAEIETDPARVDELLWQSAAVLTLLE